MSLRAADIVQMTGFGNLLKDRVSAVLGWGWVETEQTDAYHSFMQEAHLLMLYEFGDGTVEHPEDFDETRAALGELSMEGVHLCSPDAQQYVILFQHSTECEGAIYASRSGVWNDAFGDDPALRGDGNLRLDGTCNAPSVGGHVDGRSMRDSVYAASLFLIVNGPLSPSRQEKYNKNKIENPSIFELATSRLKKPRKKRWWQ